MVDAQERGSWTLLTAHGRVLVAIAQNPEARIRDLARVVGITERTAQVIVADLEATGYLSHVRVGRRNHYTVNAQRPFRHSAQDGHPIGPFLEILSRPPQAVPQTAQPPDDAREDHEDREDQAMDSTLDKATTTEPTPQD